MATRKLLRVYVDETGDRGTSPKSSSFFAFAAVLVPDEDEAGLRLAMDDLRTSLKTPPGTALHWNRHVKTFSRRQHVTCTISAVPEVRIVYVFVDKASLHAGSGMLDDHVLFYNYAAGLLLERVVYAARDWQGGPRDALVRFGHVRGFKHATTHEYFARKTRHSRTKHLPWGHLRSVYFCDQASWDGLQAADQYAGMLHAAFHADEFGRYEDVHLLAVRHQLRRNPWGSAWGYGFKLMGDQRAATSMPWWPNGGI